MTTATGSYVPPLRGAGDSGISSSSSSGLPKRTSSRMPPWHNEIVVKFGTLRKQGAVFRTWNTRMFILTPSGLRYFVPAAEENGSRSRSEAGSESDASQLQLKAEDSARRDTRSRSRGRSDGTAEDDKTGSTSIAVPVGGGEDAERAQRTAEAAIAGVERDDLRAGAIPVGQKRGTIVLGDMSAVRKCTNPVVLEVEVRSDGRVYQMIAKDELDRDAWVQAIDQLRSKPTPLTQLLRETSRLFEAGALSEGGRDDIRRQLLSGSAAAQDEARGELDRLSKSGVRDPNRGSAALERAISALRSALSERSLVESLASLQSLLCQEEVTASVRDRIVAACVAHYEQQDGRWTPVVQQAYSIVLQSVHLRADVPAAGAGAGPKAPAAPGSAAAAGASQASGASSSASPSAAAASGSGTGGSASDPGRTPEEDAAWLARRAGLRLAGASRDARKLPESPTDKDFRGLVNRGDFNELFEVHEVVGRGGYSIVHRATDLTRGRAVAAKFVSKSRLAGSSNALRSFYREVMIGKEVRHPHIVGLLGFWEVDDRWVLVSDFLTGGELFDRIVNSSTYDERQARDVVKALAEALAYMHARGVAHRDLKPENILLAGPEPDAPLRLADLGFAAEVPMRGLRSACGTPSYVAPEILQQRPYGYQADIWSLGIISYILLCGYQPFQHPNQQMLFKMIKQGNYRFDSPYWDAVSDKAKDLVSKMLQVDPARRATAEEVLEHDWITGTVGSAQLAGVRNQLLGFEARKRRVVKTGLLVKRGQIVHSWRERSFVLSGDSLEYYEPDSFAPKGVVQLKDIADVQPMTRRGAFRINTIHGRVLLVQAQDEASGREWVQSLRAQKAHSELMERAEAAMKAEKPEEALRLLRDAQRYADLVQRDPEEVGAGGDEDDDGVGGAGAAGASGSPAARSSGSHRAGGARGLQSESTEERVRTTREAVRQGAVMPAHSAVLNPAEYARNKMPGSGTGVTFGGGSDLDAAPGLEDVSLGAEGSRADVAVGTNVPAGESAMRDAREVLRRRESFRMMQRVRTGIPKAGAPAQAGGGSTAQGGR